MGPSGKIPGSNNLENSILKISKSLEIFSLKNYENDQKIDEFLFIINPHPLSPF